MQLPTNIEELFTHTHEGFKALKLRSASDAIVVENELARRRKSYQTRISRSKKRGREFVIMLVDTEPVHAA